MRTVKSLSEYKRIIWRSIKKYRYFILFLFITLGILLYDARNIGNVAYLMKWYECGTKPITVQESWPLFEHQPPEITINDNPGIFDSKVSFFTNNIIMYCSVDEAKQQFGSQLER